MSPSSKTLTIKDQILLNLLSSPIALRKKSTLNALLILEKKYPDHPGIKNQIVQFYLTNNQERDSVYKLIFIFRKFHQSSDLIQLIVHSFQTNMLNFIFFEFKEIQNLEKNDDWNFFVKAINMLKVKFPRLNFEKYVCVSQKNQKNPDNIHSTDRSYLFNINYNKLILTAQEGRLAEFFNLSKSLLRVNNNNDVINFMVEYQKVEILYFLAQKTDFFVKYYRKACTNASKEFLLVLEVALIAKNLEILTNILEFLKENDNSINYEYNDTDSDPSNYLFTD